MRAEFPLECAGGVEDLYAVVPRVGNDNVTLVIDNQTLRPEELFGAIVAFTDQDAGTQEVRFDDDYSVVVEVGHNNVTFGIEGYAARGVKVLPHVGCCLVAIFAQEYTLRAEELDTVVARIRNGDLALGVDRDIPRIVELSAAAALFAEAQQIESFHR